MLDLHVVVAEVDGPSGELLTVQGYIDRVRQHLWVKVVQLGDFGNDLAILEVSLRCDP